MKGFALSAYSRDSLASKAIDTYDQIKALQDKRAMQGGLDYRDEAVLGQLIRQFQTDITIEDSPEVGADGITPASNPAQIEEAAATARMNLQLSEVVQKAIAKLIEEYAKAGQLMTEEEREEIANHEWSENPRYKKYLKSLPKNERPIKIKVRVPTKK